MRSIRSHGQQMQKALRRLAARPSKALKDILKRIQEHGLRVDAHGAAMDPS